jgi:hypothetical protein
VSRTAHPLGKVTAHNILWCYNSRKPQLISEGFH